MQVERKELTPDAIQRLALNAEELFHLAHDAVSKLGAYYMLQGGPDDYGVTIRELSELLQDIRGD